MKIKIEKLVFEGFGLGRLPDGRPVFVYKSVPGDELEVELIEDKKSYAKGKITKIIKPSEYRTEPKCPYFEECGGCEHQNIEYKNQLKFKEEIFKETLERQGIKTKIETIIAGSQSEFYYRNSIRFFFKETSDGIEFARHNYLYKNGLVKIDKCYLQSETANKILLSLRDFINNNLLDTKPLWQFWQLKIREGKQTGEMMVEIVTTSHDLPGKKGIVETLKKIDNVKSVYHTIAPNKSLKNLERHLIFGRPVISEKIGKYTFQISPESFFQTNSLGVENLYNHIRSYAAIGWGGAVLDLYSGAGTIGIYLSPLANKVVGVESVQKAVNDAKDNAKINKLSKCEFICEDVEKYLSRQATIDDRQQTIVIDPPRAGLNKNIINKLSTINCKQVVYVSCNPATFARDIKEFEKYEIVLQKVSPIDMFPQTHHIECVGLLSNKI